MNVATRLGSKARVFEVLAAEIRASGVEAVFGLMSDDTALLITALENHGVRFFGTRHENNAVVMAEGYAAATGNLGIAVIGRGPGITNCVNALVHVSRTRTPVAVILGDGAIGQPTRNGVGPDYKSFNSGPLFEALGIATFTATSAQAAVPALRDGLRSALRGGLAAIRLPVDVQSAGADGGWQAPAQGVAPLATRPPQAARDAGVALASQILATGRRPIILAGYGAHLSGARDVLLDLAERTGALLLTTLRAKDFFRGSHFDIGVAGSFSHSLARRLVGQSDCVLAVGANLNLLTSSFAEFFPAVPLIQIDSDRSSIGRFCTADVALVGDARIVAGQLLDGLPADHDREKPYHAEEIRGEIARFHHGIDFQDAHTDWTVDIRRLALELDHVLPEDRDVVFDLGNFFAIAPFIGVPNPGCLRYTGDFGSIGLGFGTALGVAAARRGRPTFLFIGDGSLFMALAELETVAREDLPMTIFVMNDNAYGAERHFLELRDQPMGKSVFPATDFGPIAENFGIESLTVRKIADVQAVAERLGQGSGPLLVDCKINPAIPAPFLTEFARLEGY